MKKALIVSIAIIFNFLFLTGVRPVQSPKTDARKVVPDIIPDLVPEVQADMLVPDFPVNISAPAIGLSAKILPVDLTAEGIVDTPDLDAGWYRQGVKPGETGMAALNGHFKLTDFSDGIFSNLSGLKPGDDVFILDAKSQNRHFRVSEIELVNTPDFPLEKVYGQSDKARLSIVTCAGEYDRNKGTFNQRTIVYADLVI